MNSCFFIEKSRKFYKFSAFILFMIIFSVLSIRVNAADGCYVSGVLYATHTPKSGEYFYRTPNTIANCGIIGTISGACRLYDSGNTNNNSSYTRYNNSYSTNISVVDCPVDDKVWLLMIAAIGFAFMRLNWLGGFYNIFYTLGHATKRR